MFKLTAHNYSEVRRVIGLTGYNPYDNAILIFATYVYGCKPKR